MAQKRTRPSFISRSSHNSRSVIIQVHAPVSHYNKYNHHYLPLALYQDQPLLKLLLNVLSHKYITRSLSFGHVLNKLKYGKFGILKS